MLRKNNFYPGGAEFTLLFIVSYMAFLLSFFIGTVSIMVIIFSTLIYFYKKKSGKDIKNLTLFIKVLMGIIITTFMIAISAILIIRFYDNTPVSIMGWQL